MNVDNNAGERAFQEPYLPLLRKVQILLLEDHPEMRNRLKRLLTQEPQFEVVAETGEGLEAARLALELGPDVLVTDLTMPGLQGVDVVRYVRQQVPRIRIVVVSIHGEEPYVVQAFQNGALAYVRKDEVGEHLVPAIRSVQRGMGYLSPSLAELARLLNYQSPPTVLPYGLQQSSTSTPRAMLE